MRLFWSELQEEPSKDLLVLQDLQAVVSALCSGVQLDEPVAAALVHVVLSTQKLG